MFRLTEEQSLNGDIRKGGRRTYFLALLPPFLLLLQLTEGIAMLNKPINTFWKGCFKFVNTLK